MRRNNRPIKEQEAQLKDLTIQNWKYNDYSKIHSDQFGFTIEVGFKYTLLYKDEPVIAPLLSLTAAKLISAIILNDKIQNNEITK